MSTAPVKSTRSAHAARRTDAPAWYPPRGFSLKHAARAIGGLIDGPKPKRGETLKLDVTDADLTLMQTNRPLRLRDAQTHELTPYTIFYGPGDQRDRELAELERRHG